MEVLKEIEDHFIVAIILLLLTWITIKREIFIRSLKCFYYRKKECRVSFASLLSIQHGKKYLLIRNHNRRESFGPIGGVYKYFDSAKSFLSKIQFRPQQGDNQRTKNDLRGFIPISNLNEIIKWFDEKNDREVECISRELREESIIELGLSEIVYKEIPRFRALRKITEGPYLIKGKDYVQYRHLEICELVQPDDFNSEIINYLVNACEHNDDIELVTVDEIKARRTDLSGNIIGSYCGYLIGNKRTGEEDIHYK